MVQAEIVVAWRGAGTQDSPNLPNLVEDYAIAKSEDVTRQLSKNIPPTQNTFVVLVECEESVLSQIRLNPDYFVLWSEEIIYQETANAP